MARQPIVVTHRDGAYFKAISKEEYDTAIAHNRQINAEVREEREQRIAEEKRQAAAAAGRKRAEQTRQNVAQLRAAKLAAFVHEGVGTESDFDALWPDILRQHQLEQMRGHDSLASKRAQYHGEL